MNTMKQVLAVALIVFLTGETTVLAALDSGKASYVGGTFEPFKISKSRVSGRIDSAQDQLTFTADDHALRSHRLEIQYDRIQDLEFGQKTGRRVRVAAGAYVLLGPLGLLSFTSKSRRHYLTVEYTDEHGQEQVAILELGKDVVRVALAVIEMRSGKQVEYQDNDARKWAAQEGLDSGSSH
jgi:hypothetical protein